MNKHGTKPFEETLSRFKEIMECEPIDESGEVEMDWAQIEDLLLFDNDQDDADGKNEQGG